MKIYRVTVPEDIDVETGAMNEQGDMLTQKYMFARHFISHTILSDAAFGQDEETRCSAQEIRGLFKDKKPGQKVNVPERDWDRVRDVIKKPSRPYQMPQLMAQLGSFFSAWKEAELCEAELKPKGKA